MEHRVSCQLMLCSTAGLLVNFKCRLHLERGRPLAPKSGAQIEGRTNLLEESGVMKDAEAGDSQALEHFDGGIMRLLRLRRFGERSSMITAVNLGRDG